MAEEMTPELREAIIKTLYHHPKVTPMIMHLIMRTEFKTPPPPPTNEERARAETVVEEIVAHYYKAFREACIEVTGEDPENME